MPLTSVITGVNAVVNNFPSAGYVEIERTIDSTAIANSAGEGGIDRVTGNIDFTGTIFAYGYKPPSGVFPNLDFALSFTENGTNNVSCSAVKCTGLEIFVPAHDKTGKNAIFYLVHFGADGVDISIAGTGGPTPGSLPTKYCAIGCGTYLSQGTSFVRETYDQWAHLMIVADIERKVNSDTGGIYFRPAGELDWNYTYNREVNSMGLLPALNSIHSIQMQTNPKINGGTDTGAGSVGYWLINYGLTSHYKTKIDHESRLPISYDVTLEKCNNAILPSTTVPSGNAASWSLWNPDGVQCFPTYNG
jgi:hypothetical protein